MIISLDCQPVNELDLLSLNWGQILYPPGIIVVLSRLESSACIVATERVNSLL